MEQNLLLPQYNLILIRYAEIWLKSQKVKIRMLKYLMSNITKILKRKGIKFNKYQMSKDSSRVFFFFNNEDLPSAINVLKNAFGVHSFSPAIRTSNNLKNITERTIELAKDILDQKDTFALRVKRSGKHDFNSLEVATIVGKAIIDNFPNHELKVNLTQPKKQIFIEIRGDFTYIFSQIIKSKWGGLPIEPQKKILVMDIGRLNDLIAGFLLMRRGSEIYPILIDLTEEGTEIEDWISNWKEIGDYIPKNNIQLAKFRIHDVLKKVFSELDEKQYFCGICRLIRFDLISKILKNPKFQFYEKIKACTDGTSLSSSNYCPDFVDLETLAINTLHLSQPIFTPIIAFGEGTIQDLSKKISKNLKKVNYCPFKPENQVFDAEKLKVLYNRLNIDNNLLFIVENGLDINIF
ncbi:MAG TPA: THUMP domain-containing protein [Candidatus Nanopelagicaceae bacterium]|nr:THUMP domain-containing protein [Candidatus Nanopelagicaceae bacterium]